MKLSPIGTVPLRAGLLMERRRNAISQRKMDALQRKFSSWSEADTDLSTASISSRIHPYPGLGHQLAGWISGYLWARDLGINYSGGEITRDAEGLFNFLEERGSFAEVPRRTRLLSVLDERDPRSLVVLRGQVNRAMAVAQGKPVHFQLALDQPRWNQVPASSVVRQAVRRGSLGAQLDQIRAKGSSFIALHVRRGDVSPDMMGGNTGQPRWVTEEWYVEVVDRLRLNPELSELEVRLYALGAVEDFPLLAAEGVSFYLNRDRDLDFIDLCAAKVLVVAPSSFSFTAGLASTGVVVARHPWWHYVPADGRWVRADSSGSFSSASLRQALHASAR